MNSKDNEIIQDLTVGNVPAVLFRFAMPLFASGLLQTLYNMVDMVVVGNVIGSDGIAAVSIGGDLLNLLTFVAFGLSNAGQIIIAQYIGAARKDKLGRFIETLFTILMSCAAVMTAAFLLLSDSLMRWMNTPASAWQLTKDYLLTCIAGLVLIYGYNMVSAILRGFGDSRHPFLFIAIASVVNIILDIVFVAGLHMGTFGAALATVIGQGISFVFALRVLYRHKDQFCFLMKPSGFRIHADEAKVLLKLGIPMAIQSAAINISKLFVNSYINTYGVTATAVTGIGNKLELIITVISQAVSSAGGAMIAQCIGAGKYDRVKKVILTSFAMIGLPAAVLSLITVFWTDWLFGIFTSDRDVMTLAMTFVPVAIVLYIGCVARSPMFALINGTGNSKLNLSVALLDGVVTRIGLALLLGVVFHMRYYGFWYGNALSGFVPFIIGMVYYLSGRWRSRGVMAERYSLDR